MEFRLCDENTSGFLGCIHLVFVSDFEWDAKERALWAIEKVLDPSNLRYMVDQLHYGGYWWRRSWDGSEYYHMDAFRGSVVYSICLYGDDALPVLVQEVEAKGHRVSDLAIRGIGLLETEPARRVLEEMSQDPYWKPKGEAIEQALRPWSQPKSPMREFALQPEEVDEELAKLAAAAETGMGILEEMSFHRQASGLLARSAQPIWNSGSDRRCRGSILSRSATALCIPDAPWGGTRVLLGGTTLQLLMVEIVSEFGADGVELIKDVFRGTPAQWEAYLRETLSETVRALVEPGPGGISPPPVSEEAVQRLREYMELLSPTTNYVTPALPPRDDDGEFVEPSGIPDAHRCAGMPMDGNAERCGFQGIVACSQSDHRSQNEGATAMRPNVHVIKHLQGWAVVLEGNERPSYTTRTKCEAIAVGRALAAHGQSELIIYDENGRILQQDSYCRDARPPQD